MPARLAEHLVARGLLRLEVANEALRHQALAGGGLDTALLELSAIGEADLLTAIAEVSGVRLVNLAEFEPNHDVAALIPPKIADRLCVVPLSVDGGTLHVACGYPVRKAELDEVGFLLGKQLVLWVAIEPRIRDWIATIYKTPLASRFATVLAQLDPTRPVASAAVPAPAPAVSAPAPAPPPAAKPIPLVEETTLEESLSMAMIEQIAREVAAEPIPLEVVKGRGRGAPVPPPPAPAQPIAAGTPEGTRPTRPEVPAVEPSRAPTQREVPVTTFPAGGAKPAAAAVRPPPPPPEEPRGPAMTADWGAAASNPSAPVPAATRGTPGPAAPVVQPAAGARSAPQVPAARPQMGAAPSAAPGGAAAQPGTTRSGPAVPSTAAAPAATSSQPAPSRMPATPATAPSQPASSSRAPTGAQPSAAPSQPGSRAPATPGVAPAGAPPPTGAPAAPMRPPMPPPGSAAPSAPSPSAIAAVSSVGADPNEATRNLVPDWTLAQARAALKESTSDREKLIDVALRFARRTFDYVAAFAVIRGTAVGWDVRGEGTDRAQLSQVSIPLDSASVFRTVALTRGSYVGPLPPDALSRHFLEQMGRAPRTVFLYPVEVKARLVAILYGDCGSKPVSQLRLSEFILLCQELPAAFQELILQRKQRVAQINIPIDVEEPAPARPATTGLGWSPFASNELGGLGRAASVPALAIAEGERPPPDFGVVLRRLTGPDAAQRARAMAELARSPEASARALAEAFPGPTAWSRLPVQELPEADELGPIPGAISRLGRPGAQALAPLLDSDDSDTRYLALLTAGNLPYPELVDGILRGLFDLEPDISSAARAAATSFRRVARFDASMRDLRQELASRDAMRRSLAARALGVLHDREAIDGLIMLTGSDDSLCAQAAAEALKEITRANFGAQPRSWTMWWAENRGRRRADWLVAALRSNELEQRQAAFEELTRATSDAMGYDPDDPPAEREPAVRRWEAFLLQKARTRFDVI